MLVIEIYLYAMFAYICIYIDLYLLHCDLR